MNTKTRGLAILAIVIVAAIAAAGLYGTHRSALSDNATTTVDVLWPAPEATTTTPVAPVTYHSGDSAAVVAHINQTVTAVGESITPTAVVDDSRCPTDVQCIWAGTVHVQITVSDATSTVIELGKQITTKTSLITLESVSPDKNSKKGTDAGEYEFTFTVLRR